MNSNNIEIYAPILSSGIGRSSVRLCHCLRFAHKHGPCVTQAPYLIRTDSKQLNFLMSYSPGAEQKVCNTTGHIP